MKKLIFLISLITSVSIFADVKSDYEKAKELAGNGNYTESVKLLEALSNGTDKEYSFKASYQLGSYYFAMGDVKKAEPYFTKVINANPKSSEAIDSMYRLAIMYEIAGEKDKAEKNFIAYRNNVGEDEKAEATTALLQFYLYNNKIDKAAEEYKKIITLPNNEKNNALKSTIAMNIGKNYFVREEYTNAQKYYEDALKYVSGNDRKEIIDKLGQIAYVNDDTTKAKQYYEELNKLTNNSDSEYLSKLGLIYMNEKNYTKAEENFKKAEIANPKDLSNKLLLLELYEDKNDQAKVTQYVKEVEKINSKSVNKNIGIYFAQSDRADLAEKYLNIAIKGGDESARLALGQVYYNEGKKAEGIELIKEASKKGVKEAAAVLKEIENLEKK